jgi:death-on-curing protein
MRYPSVSQIAALQAATLKETGGAAGLRDRGALESAVTQPRMTFGGVDLYPSLAEKAVAIGFSLVRNHPFVDGNKRIGHAAMEALLMLNGHELAATVDDAERAMLRLAAGELTREELVEWITRNMQPLVGGA